MARSVTTRPGRDASTSQVTLLQFARFPQQFAGTHLLLGEERHYESQMIKCLAQEHNIVSSASTRSGDKHTNHEATK